tara:strand:- start:591 stop:728 length:138 start_codon:yes stop_codon:yes gene_type:complete
MNWRNNNIDSKNNIQANVSAYNPSAVFMRRNVTDIAPNICIIFNL